MATPDYGLFIQSPKRINLHYSIPDHLKRTIDIDSMREVDLNELCNELDLCGSSFKEKIEAKIIWRMSFPGMILDVNEILQNSFGEVSLYLSPIHPHRADLSYMEDSTLMRRPVPLTVSSILLDKNANPVLGIRGGDVESGMIASFPGGHVDFEYNQKGINSSMLLEFYEELGSDIPITEESLQLIGIMDNKDTRGINILYSIKTRASFSGIKKSWESAKDRFEHNSIIPSSNSMLESIVKNKKVLHKGKLLQTTPFFLDCFSRYLSYLYN
jgi:8-oxo-dGTP pyrophosphatase MutT (NUDIX family)